MKKRFVPEDILNMSFLAEPCIAGKGNALAYTAYQASADETYFASHILMGTSDDMGLLKRDGSQKYPKFSPDGQSLAFVSNESGQWQIWLQDLQSGQCRQLTHVRYGVGRFAWSPLGTEIAFEAAWWDEDYETNRYFTEMSDGEAEAHAIEREMAPQIIEEINYKRDETFGVFDGSCSYICMVEAVSGTHRILCGGEYPASNPAFSGDGRCVTFLGRPHKGPEGQNYEVFVCNVDGTGLCQVTNDGKYVMNNQAPCFTSDGRALVYLVMDINDGGDTTVTLYRSDLQGGSAELLLPAEDNGICTSGWCLPMNRSVFTYDETLYTLHQNYIYFLSSRNGRELLCRIPDAGGKIELVLSGDFCVSGFSIADDGDILYRCGDPRNLASIRRHTKDADTCLSHENTWLKDREEATVHEQWFDSVDGKVKIQSWVSLPEQVKEGERIPVVLYIHGGPTCTSVFDFWHEVQALTSAGMAVVICNPRGSLGYGMKFGNSELAWEQEGVDDLIKALDTACDAFPCIDGQRAGVTGGSYGGYMTVKLVGVTKRFRAAVGQRVLCNTATSYGTGDMGFYSAAQDPATINMWDILSKRAKKSLVNYADQIDTPFLILHGCKDYRCGYEQAEQLFAALKDRRPNLPVRLVMFPTGNHGVARDGRPCDMVRHVREMVDWFIKYLNGDEINE